MTETTLTQHLRCLQRCWKWFTCINSLNAQSKSIPNLRLLSPFYRKLRHREMKWGIQLCTESKWQAGIYTWTACPLNFCPWPLCHSFFPGELDKSPRIFLLSVFAQAPLFWSVLPQIICLLRSSLIIISSMKPYLILPSLCSFTFSVITLILWCFRHSVLLSLLQSIISSLRKRATISIFVFVYPQCLGERVVPSEEYVLYWTRMNEDTWRCLLINKSRLYVSFNFILFSANLWPKRKYFYWILVRHSDDSRHMGPCLF